MRLKVRRGDRSRRCHRGQLSLQVYPNCWRKFPHVCVSNLKRPMRKCEESVGARVSPRAAESDPLVEVSQCGEIVRASHDKKGELISILKNFDRFLNRHLKPSSLADAAACFRHPRGPPESHPGSIFAPTFLVSLSYPTSLQRSLFPTEHLFLPARFICHPSTPSWHTACQ